MKGSNFISPDFLRSKKGLCYLCLNQHTFTLDPGKFSEEYPQHKNPAWTTQSGRQWSTKTLNNSDWKFSSAVRCCWGRERVYSFQFTVYRLRFAVWVILKKTKWILQEAYADKKYSQLNLHHSHFVRHSLWRRRIKPPLRTLTLDLPPIPSDSRREGTAVSLSAEALAKADCPWASNIEHWAFENAWTYSFHQSSPANYPVSIRKYLFSLDFHQPTAYFHPIIKSNHWKSAWSRYDVPSEIMCWIWIAFTLDSFYRS